MSSPSDAQEALIRQLERIALALEGQLEIMRRSSSNEAFIADVVSAQKRMQAFHEQAHLEATEQRRAHNDECLRWHRRVMEQVGVPVEPEERLQ